MPDRVRFPTSPSISASGLVLVQASAGAQRLARAVSGFQCARQPRFRCTTRL
jgi:hypothetical protein